MEPRDLLSAGQSGGHGLTPEEIARRIAALPAPGRRRSPQSAAETAAETAPNTARERPRGDHDLNPDFYDPAAALTPAAVLVPIVEHPGGPTVLLTKRTDHLHDHAGQVSFPGGRVDPGDADAEAAALREAEEEVGLAPAQVRLIGRIDTYVTRTGFEVTPVVGLVAPPLSLTLDAFEVAEVFEVPLGFFLEADSRQRHSRVYQGVERHFYAYPYDGYFIWGATAGMLSNLAEVLGRP